MLKESYNKVEQIGKLIFKYFKRMKKYEKKLKFNAN